MEVRRQRSASLALAGGRSGPRSRCARVWKALIGLVAKGIRDEVALMASGGVRTAEDALKAIALGADGVVLGTAELVAIDCVRCCNCERGRGCPIGIATTDPVLAPQVTPELVQARISNMYRAWAEHFALRLRELGLASIRDLRGRRDLLVWAGGEMQP